MRFVRSFLFSTLAALPLACTGSIADTETAFDAEEGVLSVEASNDAAGGRWRGRLVLEGAPAAYYLVFVGDRPVTSFADIAAFDERSCPVFGTLPRVGLRLPSIASSFVAGTDDQEAYEARSTSFTLEDVASKVYFTVVREDLAVQEFRVRFEITPEAGAGRAILRPMAVSR
jgi:hypothetical protein